jgi:biopolymer transport protein ExbD
MQSRRHTSDTHETGIDLAPMLDFVVNLLIFFIITTSFIKESGTTVIRPEANTAQPRESGNILIAIKPTGEVWMDRRQVDLRQIRPTIERLHIERPDDTVVIIADKNSRAGLLGLVMDEVQQGGIKEVAIAAAPAAGG